jgi:serine/threonine-protein kinase
MSATPTSYGRYEITGEIGDGAMGRVYRAWDPLVRRAVAIKTLKRERLVPAETADALRRFQREAQAAGALSHPHIVNIFDVGDDYIVMELLEGVSLHALLETRGPLPLKETLALLRPVAEALDHAHDAGVIHRDIKPSNIMVSPEGRPKLTDFGLARLESAAATRPGEVFGSPSYMAPEQVAGDTVTPRVDVYALAVVAFECLTGRRPFEGQHVTEIVYRVLHEQAPSVRALAPELPAGCGDVLARALDKDPQRRFPSAWAFVDALGQAAGEPAAAPPPPRAPVVRPRSGPIPAGEGTLSYDDLRDDAPVPPAAAPGAAPAPARAPSRARGAALALAAAAAVAFVALLPRYASSRFAPAPGARLSIISQPDGASVFVDEREVGVTPLELDLAHGSHTVRVARAGFGPAQLGVEVDGSPLTPLRFLLQPLAAHLTVASRPARAIVRLDGQVVGYTPLERLTVPPGVHEVSVEQPGYAPFARTLAIEAGEVAVLEAALTRGRPTPERRFATGDLVAPGTPGVSEPVRVRGQAPVFPPEALAARVHGSVLASMIIDEHGQPTHLRVVESAGEVLDQAFLAAAREWRFEPARKDGVALKYPLSWRQTFRLP